MVAQNSENGGQDGQYTWARDITYNSAQVRYCEADGANYCDSHNAEDVMWFSLAYSSCGDAVVDGVEECDDGNHSDGDGCSSACLIES